MKLIWALYVCVLIAPAGVLSAQLYDLSSRPLPEGTTLSAQGQARLEGGISRVFDDGEMTQGVYEYAMRQRVGLTIVEADEVRAVRVDLVVHEMLWASTMEVMGDLDESELESSLVGMTVPMCWSHAEEDYLFAQSLVPGFSIEQSDEARRLSIDSLNETLLPERPVAIGDQWVLDRNGVQAYLGNRFNLISGRIEVTLESVDDGVAVLGYEAVCSAVYLDYAAFYDEAIVSYRERGELRRDITAGVNLSLVTEGDMRMLMRNHATSVDPEYYFKVTSPFEGSWRTDLD